MSICKSSQAVEEKKKTATQLFPELVSSNQSLNKILSIVSISILLSGCSAIVAIPLPLRIASNVHTTITVLKNVDDNPDNDSKIVTYLKESSPRNETDTTKSMNLNKSAPQTQNQSTDAFDLRPALKENTP